MSVLTYVAKGFLYQLAFAVALGKAVSLRTKTKGAVTFIIIQNSMRGQKIFPQILYQVVHANSPLGPTKP